MGALLPLHPTTVLYRFDERAESGSLPLPEAHNNIMVMSRTGNRGCRANTLIRRGKGASCESGN